MSPSPREVELEIEVRLLKDQIRELISRLASGPRHEEPRPVLAVVDRNANKDWTKVDKRCPQCKRTKRVMPTQGGFGTKMIRGTTYPQSWCNDCRNKTAYYVPVAERTDVTAPTRRAARTAHGPSKRTQE